MNEPGEVLKGLRCLMDGNILCNDCAYAPGSSQCKSRVAADAAELINSLAPRVLTLDEAHCADECWFEWKDGPCGYAEILWAGKDTIDINRIYSHGATSVFLYGRKWRCWSYRPTEKQRKETHWDDDPQ